MSFTPIKFSDISTRVLPAWNSSQTRYIATTAYTHRNEYVQSPGDGRFQVRVQDDCSELHLVSRFVDGFVRLYEHRVALVHVLQRGGVEEFQATRAAGRQVVVAGADIADL